MKTYRIKNYKGNLVESIKKFQAKHSEMKIVEATEDGEELKVKAEEPQKVEEAKQYIYALAKVKAALGISSNDKDSYYSPLAIFTSVDTAKKVAKKLNSEHPLAILRYELDNKNVDTHGDNFKEISRIVRNKETSDL